MKRRHSFILAILLCLSILAFGQWSGDPMENTTVRNTNGMLIVAHVAACDNGNSYVSWYSTTEGFRFDLVMQCFDVSGQKLWGDVHEVIAICRSS